MGISREYRLVGGDRHGQIEFLEDATFLYAPPEPEAIASALEGNAPLTARTTVTYRQQSFGSNRGPDLPALRLDVMLAEELHVKLEDDPRDAEVAWAVLDAFMIDIPNARAVDERTSLARCKRAIIEARAAWKRARFALPKEPRDTTQNAVAWFAENGLARCDIALDYIDGRPVPRAAEEAQNG